MFGVDLFVIFGNDWCGFGVGVDLVYCSGIWAVLGGDCGVSCGVDCGVTYVHC